MITPEAQLDFEHIGGPLDFDTRKGAAMKLRDAITVGVKPLAQNRLRAGLSILGISIGIAGVLCMIAIGDGGKLIIAQNLEMMGGANQIAFGHGLLFGRGRGSSGALQNDTPLRMPLQLRQNALMYCMSCLKWKTSTPLLATGTGIRRKHV